MNIPILKLPFDEALTGRITARIARVLQSGKLVVVANPHIDLGQGLSVPGM